ncbi:MAG: DUF4446 family protein [Chloroflexota bacterium]
MTDLDRLLTDNLTVAFGLLVGVVALLLILVVLQTSRLRRAVKSYRDLVRDDRDGGGSLHELLAAHADQIAKAGSRMTEMEELHDILIRRTEQGIQHIGLVRFNPFEDTGSDQSFALALLDARHDGIVLSSLHGRASTRVFAKSIEGGRSAHPLSDEEAAAMRIALEETRPL